MPKLCPCKISSNQNDGIHAVDSYLRKFILDVSFDKLEEIFGQLGLSRVFLVQISCSKSFYEKLWYVSFENKLSE